KPRPNHVPTGSFSGPGRSRPVRREFRHSQLQAGPFRVGSECAEPPGPEGTGLHSIHLPRSQPRLKTAPAILMVSIMLGFVKPSWRITARHGVESFHPWYNAAAHWKGWLMVVSKRRRSS